MSLHQRNREEFSVGLVGLAAENREKKSMAMFEQDLNLEATELRLGLPGTKEPEHSTCSSALISRSNKRPADMNEDEDSSAAKRCDQPISQPPPSKAQVVGWPPVRSYRKNCLQTKKTEAEGCGIYVKISMDGAPYLRKMDLKVYRGYPELLKAWKTCSRSKLVIIVRRNWGSITDQNLCLHMKTKMGIGCYLEMFHGTTFFRNSNLIMWCCWFLFRMFITSCKRLRIMKGSEAKGLGCAL
ncbi:AUX/IAA transcriptional regulator family protein [Prunus dulcis]|uniref:Auxin-responsive protein n=1 Tax=Prunus dulcis TaxID=3755 RepID=A0A4Y1RSE4_PRUDU|nr:AUX/IAA transcriptional regulator family protein [Prunus dulcis]